MSMDIVGQYLINCLMLGVIYAMVAVGFTLFFGVMDVIQFSHGDVLMLGGFTALAVYGALQSVHFESAWLTLLIMLLVALAATALVGALIARFLVLPLRHAPPLNTLLITLMFGLVIRELVRLFYPNGSNPQPFPHLLATTRWHFGNLLVRADSLILLVAGLVVILGLHLLITRTKLGLAIRAVAQDSETARIMGIDFQRVVLLTFGIGSALAAFAGVMDGLYYSEMNFDVGVLLGVIGFSAAILGGLGNFYGAILGGFLFAALQTVGSVVLPLLSTNMPSSYRDVFAFAAVIVLIAWRPTGLLAEQTGDRV